MSQPNVMCDPQLDPRLKKKMQSLLWGQLKKCKHGPRVGGIIELNY